MSETPTQRLIAELERGAGEGEAGAWTLDEAAARRKLAEHRLADPQVWLCTIVEAAVLLGAWTVRIERRVDALRIEFNGLAPALDGLFGAVFGGSSGDPSTRAARKLAIAFETMLERAEVASVEVEAGPERLTLTKDARSIASREPLGMTSIVVRRGLSWPELELLAERGRYARASIHVSSTVEPEGEPISRGLEQALVDAGATHARWPITREGQTIGWLGHRPYADLVSKVVLVSDGIVAEEVALPGKGEVVVVECSLAKDLGENKVLRNADFERLYASVEALCAAHPHVPAAEPVLEPRVEARVSSWITVLIMLPLTIVFAGMLVATTCSPNSPTLRPMPPSAAPSLHDQLSRADTFARCGTHELPGGRLTQLRIRINRIETSHALHGARVIELNGVHEFDRNVAAVARCIEAQAGVLALDQARRDRGTASAPRGYDEWVFEY